MTRIFGLPAMLSVAVLGLLTACATPPADPRSLAVAVAAPAKPAKPYMAQVVGVQWLNPLVWKDYPTEWNLLWTLGLAKPNANDEVVKEEPAKFSSVQPIGTIVYAAPGVTFANFFRGYFRNTVDVFASRYAMNPRYFYTIHNKDRSTWRELAGIHIEMAIPVSGELPADEAKRRIEDKMLSLFEFNVPALSTRRVGADVRITTGGASAGFRSLAAAMDYLKTHPKETAWAMNWDAPAYPLDEKMSENCALLILAGPDYNTEREPVAWIAEPAVRSATEFNASGSDPRELQASKAALSDAATRAGIEQNRIGYVIHDAGFGGDVAGRRLGLVGRTLTASLPEIDFTRDTFNTPKLTGDMRAGSALTNVALAIAWTHQKGKPVLVLGTTEPGESTAVVVLPPARPRLADPARNWFRARGQGNAYLPWWGLRKDTDWSKQPQGFSE